MDSQWLKLMRYNKSLFGYKSEVDTPGYFLSPDGKSDPKAELRATLSKFQEDLALYEDPNLHPVCLFPGRYIFLKRNGKIKTDFDLSNCPEYSKFANKLELKSASVIFSSYYINKPASAFGHTLLKLNKEDPLTSDLKSYGVDFSAKVTTKNPFMYGVLGILGGFYGRFSLMPYFLKLREYNDYESRDLWEFELDLNERDLELLTAHLWDMNRAAFDYYYFTENCSYHILRFIDAVKPEWKLWDEVYFTLIPVDTLIPLVEKEDVLKGIYLRPSLYARAYEQLESLNRRQKAFASAALNELALDPEQASSLEEEAQALDAVIDFLDFKYPSEIHLGKKNDQVVDFKRQVLLRRSRLGVKTKLKKKEKKEGFDYSHPARKFGVSYRDSNDERVGSGYELRHRFALHNIMESKGDIYSDFSLEMGKLTLFYRQTDEKLMFENFELAHVEALRPVSDLERKISWNFSVGVEREDLDYKKIGGFLDVGAGYSYRAGSNMFALFLQTENSQLLKESNDSKIGLGGPNFQWLYRSGDFAFKANYKQYYDFERGESGVELYGLKAGYQFNKSALLSLGQEQNYNDRRSSVSLSLYY